jgi:antitoxin (DNA-binding transcriptional repressor) of toxin-antitoxin stability system
MQARRIQYRRQKGETSMRTAIPVEEAQAHVRELIGNLAPGEELIITEGHRPVAKIVGQGVPALKPRQPGSAKGKLIILEDDDEHLMDFEDAATI